MRIPELAALLSFATLDQTSKVQLNDRILQNCGLLGAQPAASIFDFIKIRQSGFSQSETLSLVQALELPAASRYLGPRGVFFDGIVDCLANGASHIPSSTLVVFLTFVCALPSAEKAIHAVEAMTGQKAEEMDGIKEAELLETLPALISVANAVVILVDPNWSPVTSVPDLSISQADVTVQDGGLSFDTVLNVLAGVVTVTYGELVSEGATLPPTELLNFLDVAARNLSELMLQQTLLEQAVFRRTSTPGHFSSTQELIAQSKELMLRYLKDPLLLEKAMNEIWQDSLTDYLRRPSLGQMAGSAEETSLPDPSTAVASEESFPPYGLADRRGAVVERSVQAMTVWKVFDRVLSKRSPNPQDPQFNIRFLLFLALLYGTAALGFVFHRSLGISIAMSLFATCGVALFLAATALYVTRRRCRQLGDEASKNFSGLLSAGATRAAVDDLLRDNRTGALPTVRSVVDSLVSPQSRSTTIPAVRQRGPNPLAGDAASALRTEGSDCFPPRPPGKGAPIRQGMQCRPLGGEMATGWNVSHSGSMASRLRGIVSTVGKIAAQFNSESNLAGLSSVQRTEFSRSSGGYSRESSGRERQQQTSRDIMLDAYPHMKNSV